MTELVEMMVAHVTCMTNCTTKDVTMACTRRRALYRDEVHAHSSLWFYRAQVGDRPDPRMAAQHPGLAQRAGQQEEVVTWIGFVGHVTY